MPYDCFDALFNPVVGTEQGADAETAIYLSSLEPIDSPDDNFSDLYCDDTLTD